MSLRFARPCRLGPWSCKTIYIWLGTLCPTLRFGKGRSGGCSTGGGAEHRPAPRRQGEGRRPCVSPRGEGRQPHQGGALAAPRPRVVGRQMIGGDRRPPREP